MSEHDFNIQARQSLMQGWLTPMDQNYKLSLGAIHRNSVSDHIVKPFTYTEFIITEVPVDDAYPNAGSLW